ncbi:MAG TPA: hypothetical protein VF794_04125 [Archangium sp.]|uniref:hypothetical protein n=1 Tax=Archangium sp. TaxID=1872627 RepID=UPI002EDBACC8
MENPQAGVMTGDTEAGPRALTLCEFNIYAQSAFISRDQRTGTANYEGELELGSRFTVNDFYSANFPSSGNVKVSQGATVAMNTLVHTVSIDNTGMASLKAEMWEYEYGFGGGTDSGSATGYLNLDCNQPQAMQKINVSISGNTWLEKTATVEVTFLAVKK